MATCPRCNNPGHEVELIAAEDLRLVCFCEACCARWSEEVEWRGAPGDLQEEPARV
jgi:hypothetical protein